MLLNRFAVHPDEEAAAEALPLAPRYLRAWHAVRPAHDHHGPCGDILLVLPLSCGRTAIVVLDVAGHSPARAPLSSVIAEVITTALMHDASPAAALGSADEYLRTSGEDSPYAVAFAALIHPVLRTVIYASAGHGLAFVLANDGRVRHLAPTSPMLVSHSQSGRVMHYSNSTRPRVSLLRPMVSPTAVVPGRSTSSRRTALHVQSPDRYVRAVIRHKSYSRLPGRMRVGARGTTQASLSRASTLPALPHAQRLTARADAATTTSLVAMPSLLGGSVCIARRSQTPLPAAC